MASISIYEKTSKSVTVYLVNLDETWTNGTRTVNWYLGYAGGSIPSANAYYKRNIGNSLANGVSSSGKVTFSGLEASTEYAIYCEVYHGTTLLANFTGWVVTEETNISLPSDWNWSISNGEASAEQTTEAFKAVTKKTATTNFSFLVWNDMVDKVWLVLEEIGYGWNSEYADYEDTKMTEEDREMTATRFNSLRYNIYYHLMEMDDGRSMEIEEVWPGDYVLGFYFKKLCLGINDLIRTAYGLYG